MEPKKRHNAEIALACLLDGRELEGLVEGNAVSLQEDKEGNKILCMKAKTFKYSISEEHSTGEDIHLPIEISLSHFIKLCEAMSEEQRIGLVAYRALTSLKQKNKVAHNE